MKIRHNVPVDLLMKSDPITPEYQAEIDRTMAHAQSAHNRAAKRLAAAERRLERAQRVHTKQANKRTRREVQHLEILVELRRVELEQVHRVMVSTGAPSTSRGRKSHRHVSTAEAVL